MKFKCIAALLSLSLVLTLFSTVVLANKTVDFNMQIDEDGDIFKVSIQASHVKDLFAYDLSVKYDTIRLKLVDAKSEFSGYSVDPIVNGNLVRFAHTKIGDSPGINGDVSLVLFTFKRIFGGPAVITLGDVKLVDSELDMVSYLPNLQISVPSSLLMSDIAGHWAELLINEAINIGFVTGYEDGTFRPQLHVTRAEFSAMLARALKLPIVAEADLTFADYDSIPMWARSFILAVVEANLLKGYEDRTFRSNRWINRTEMTVMIVRALGEVPINEKKFSFEDADYIPAWGQAYVSAAANRGLIHGREGNRFAPRENLTRAEAVVVIMNLLNNIDGMRNFALAVPQE